MPNVPVSKITLFSSGVGFFEHSGCVSGTKEITLPFNTNAVNDALKSLVISDPEGCPAVSYPSEETFSRTLMSLSINLNGSSIQSMLQSLKGAEIEVFAPKSIKGRIIFAERRTINEADKQKLPGSESVNGSRDYLSLFTSNGIKTVCIDEISHFTFSDPKITEDLNRALDLAMKSQDDKTRNLTIELAGNSERRISFGYVIPAAVWKASYRLNINLKNSFLQGWAIVDNNSDNDWNNIELALVTGKPVSFIQDLYKIHNPTRPIIPLLTEGIADAKTYDSGSSKSSTLGQSLKRSIEKKMQSVSLSQDDIDAILSPISGTHEAANEDDNSQIGSLINTAASRPAGDQFEYTIKKPVSLSRQQSAMLPLVEGIIEANKYLVFSREEKNANCAYNPAICVELTNNTGMKLPAGPITVYDGMSYAGDALIKFFPIDEKRLISYGEDLSVTCSFITTVSEKVSLIKIENGLMKQNRKTIYQSVYTFRNAGNETKKIIIEHPLTPRADLISPVQYSEKTHNLYRFTETLPSSDDFIHFSVTEEKVLCEELEIINFHYEKLASFLSDKAVTQKKVQEVLNNVSSLNQKIIKAGDTHKDLKDKLKQMLDKQERTRKNIDAAGNQSQQGKEYLQRLAREDSEIDALEEKINTAMNAIEEANKEYEKYLLGIKLE